MSKLKYLLSKIKYLYKTNWIFRFTVNFGLLYIILSIVLTIVVFLFDSVNNIVTLGILFVITLGVTGFLQHKK